MWRAPYHEASMSGGTPRASGSWMSYAPTFALDLAGRVAPKTVAKCGVLTMDGIRRWVDMSGGMLKIYADEAASKLFLCAEMTWVEVVGNTATPQTRHLPRMSPTEIRITVEPEALNREIDAIRGSGPGGMGMGPMGMPGAGMMNRAPQTTERTGDVQRVVVTLFAETSAEKMAWFAILQATASGRRTWAYARHEAGVTMNAARDSMGRARSAR